MDKIEEIARQDRISLSKQIFSILKYWVDNREPEAPLAPKAEAPKLMASKEELDNHLSQLSIEELAIVQAWGLTVNDLATKHWKERKFPSKKRRSFTEEIAESLK